MEKYCKKCGSKISPQDKYCLKCGQIINNKALDLFKANRKFIIPIIIGISIIFCLFTFLFLVFIFLYDDNSDEIKKENITRCYSEEAYVKLMDLYKGRIDGNFKKDIECSELIIKDEKYNKINVIIDNGNLLGIYVKNGIYDKYIYYIDKRYDIYDPVTLEIKEKADEALVNKLKEEEAIEKARKKKEKKLQKLLNLGFSLDQADSVYKILNDCGIKKLTNLKQIESVDGTETYTLEYEDILVTFNCNNKLINKVFSGDIILYDLNTGEKKNINDFYISDAEMVNVRKNSIEYVKQYLKSPSTAKFPGKFLNPYYDWSIKKNDGNYLVSSYVDAQNSFGAIIRNNFTIEWIKKGDNQYEVSSFIFNGEQIK